MRSNYKRLGDYIEVVNKRNKKLEVETLLGVSIKKVLMPSIANTIGTDMSTYKIIKRNQFAYGSVTSRNGDKISIAILDEYDKAIVSQAYTVFKIIDETQLLPEYLMMWFRRPEFDRYARFKSHGSARETFDWDEMLEIELPVPSIETQQEIVDEYHTITKRIDLNEQLNQKLEETAQAIYKQWFMDSKSEEIEFLKEYIETNPKLELKKGVISTYIEMTNLSETSMSINSKIRRKYKGGARFQNNDTLLARITPCLENGKTAFINVLEKDEIAGGSTEFIVMRAKENVSPYWVYNLAKDEEFRAYAISSMIGSSGRQRVHEKYLGEFQLPKINSEQMEKFDRIAKPIFDTVRLRSLENQKLYELKASLLSKMATVIRYFD